MLTDLEILFWMNVQAQIIKRMSRDATLRDYGGATKMLGVVAGDMLQLHRELTLQTCAFYRLAPLPPENERPYVPGVFDSEGGLYLNDHDMRHILGTAEALSTPWIPPKA